MITYKDMTFCAYYQECANRESCNRALTKTIKDKAKNFGLPISQFASRPNCWQGEE